MRTLLLPVVVAALAGCAYTTTVRPAVDSRSDFDDAVYPGKTVELNAPTPGAPVYRVFERGNSGYTDPASVRKGVEDAATAYCARRGRTVRPIQERASTPPHVLGNIPRVEWLFECSAAAAPTAPR